MDTLEEHGGWRKVLTALTDRDDLSPELAAAALDRILDGTATHAQIGAFLAALRTKGATPGEVVAMVGTMLHHAAPLDLPDADATVDIVGTGGSRLRQDRAFNISTTACFVVAGAGVPVCKHGNRKASSSSGSTDVLEALGVAVELDGDAVRRCVAEAGIGFAFARLFHPAMRHAAPVRMELGIPTVFNILGPLSHPGRVRRQVIGVADPALAPMVVDVLRRRGSPRAMVVHGSDGLDELTLSGPSYVWELREGDVGHYEVHPAHLGMEVVVTEDIGVGAPEANAEAVGEVLGGSPSHRRDVVVLNAAAGLIVAGAADDFAAAIELANTSIDSGSAAGALTRLIDASHRAG